MQTINNPLPETRNESFGFWGTMGGHACLAWPIALQSICKATGENAEDVRIFMDSRFGRHFADSVRDALHQGLDMEQAIDQAVSQWMSWKIGRATHGQYGIPIGVPHLTGFVIHSNIDQD